MKKLGLVGGMGPESTIPYYRGIVYGVQEKAGCFPNLTVESVSVFDVLDFCAREDYDGLLHYLTAAIDHLAAAGADFAALSANTPHIVFDRLQACSPLPLVSIVEAVCREAARQGLKKLGLLGTGFTMEADFFKAPFTAQGIEIVTPAPEERRWVGEKISQELELGVVKPETQNGFDAILNRLRREEGIEAAVLGCTELPLLFQDRAAPLPCLDTMDIHIQTLVDEILS